jgi:hypothetical protein
MIGTNRESHDHRVGSDHLHIRDQIDSIGVAKDHGKSERRSF